MSPNFSRDEVERMNRPPESKRPRDLTPDEVAAMQASQRHEGCERRGGVCDCAGRWCGLARQEQQAAHDRPLSYREWVALCALVGGNPLYPISVQTQGRAVVYWPVPEPRIGGNQNLRLDSSPEKP